MSIPPSTLTPPVTFMVPVHESAASRRWFPRFLNSFHATTDPDRAALLVLVNGTEQWQHELREYCHDSMIVLGENMGFVGAVNAGMRAARGRTNGHIGLLNTDVDFLPGWLEPMEYALQNPLVGAVGHIAMRYPSGMIMFIEFSCVLFNRDATRREPFLDPRYGFGYFDDNDLCLQLLMEGWRLEVVSPPRIVHHAGGSAANGQKKMIADNCRVFLEKWTANRDPHAIEACGALRSIYGYTGG